MTSPDPSLDSFNPELIALLKRASLSSVELRAEKGAPTVTRLSRASASPAIAPNQHRTRWDILTFTNQVAALRYRELQRMATALHRLRRKMKNEQHPDAPTVYRVKITLDERDGALRLSPLSDDFGGILREVPALSLDAPTLEEDPLAKL